MKLVIVLLTHINNLPPARNILLSLAHQGIDFTLITMYSSALPIEIRESETCRIIDIQSNFSKNRISALFTRLKRRKKLRKLLKTEVNTDDVIWTITDYDAMEAGVILLKHRHVMQLMELIHDIPIFDEIPFIKANIAKYARHAELLIVPEYNRAHIQKTYWDLSKTPLVLPNKPNVALDESVDLASISPIAADVLGKIGNRKIILYQGTFGYERVLDLFIEATDILGKEYCFLLMGNDDDELKKLLKKYPQAFFIPFIAAPNHLYVTKRAHIGVLSYVNTHNIRHYDPLNALYCAPNKIYEYASFGVPMIGNDIPGLDLPFRQFNMGICSELKADSIATNILKIENNYETLSNNCRHFYDSVNIDKAIKDIVDRLNNNC